VTAIDQIGRVQEIFDDYGIKPCYVVDYPVAATEKSAAMLRSIFDDGRCEIGAHLHPWVNPPIEEKISPFNTYPGNLSPELEEKKLATLTQALEGAFGQRPDIYKAGRYGVGPNSTQILERLGYSIDLSICPGFNYSGDGGPDFSRYGTQAFWFGRDFSMLALPLSGGFVGVASSFGRDLFEFGSRLRKLRVPGILSRLNIVDRLMLSPEGFTPSEHRRLVRALMSRGERLFTWSFHSSSVEPGMTAYTRDDQELGRFLDSFRYFFDFFLGEIGGVATTPTEVRLQLERGR